MFYRLAKPGKKIQAVAILVLLQSFLLLNTVSAAETASSSVSAIQPECCVTFVVQMSRDELNAEKNLNKSDAQILDERGEAYSCRLKLTSECDTDLKSSTSYTQGRSILSIERAKKCSDFASSVCASAIGAQKDDKSTAPWSCVVEKREIDGASGKETFVPMCLDLRLAKHGLAANYKVAYDGCYMLCEKTDYRNCLFTTTAPCNGQGDREQGNDLQFYSSQIKTTVLFNEGAANLRENVDKVKRLNVNSVPELISKMVKVTLGFTGSIALVFFIYSGILWMISAGNSDRQSRAQKSLVWTSLGILAILGSYILTDFIIQALLNK